MVMGLSFVIGSVVLTLCAHLRKPKLDLAQPPSMDRLMRINLQNAARDQDAASTSVGGASAMTIGGDMAMQRIGALALALLTIAGSADAASDSLPLRHGVYVDVNTECRGAPSATKTWFGGGYVIQSSHATCTLQKVAPQSSTSYVITALCYEYGDRSMPFVMVDRLEIQSQTEYSLTNQFGRFRARWCRG
jgi:hypothetical protein